jgi:tetratricopeptide (TPR) repeat protein
MEMTWLNAHGAPTLEAQALFRRALEMAGLGRYEEAVDGLRQAVMIAPRFTRAYEELGNCLERLGRYPEALNAYTKVLEIDLLHQEAGRKLQVMVDIARSSLSNDQAFVAKQCTGGGQKFPLKTTTTSGGKEVSPATPQIDNLAELARKKQEKSSFPSFRLIYRQGISTRG